MNKNGQIGPGDYGYTVGPGGMLHFKRLLIGGLPVALLDRRCTANLIVAAALFRRGSGVRCFFFTSANGQVISLCASNPEVRQLWNLADLISADGQSVVFASRLRGDLALPERVATTDLFHDVARIAQEVGCTFYLFGATEGVNALAAKRAIECYPTLKIVGRRHGFFSPADEHDIVDSINAAAPDVLWIGLGVPQQQQFIARNRHRLTSVGVAKTCGGLFDFMAGSIKRAPSWMQRGGLEWAYRAYQEPWRLTWRYLQTNPRAAYALLRGQAAMDDGVIDTGGA